MAAEDDPGRCPVEPVDHFLEDRRDLSIPVLLPPGRPALEVVLEVGDDDFAVLDRRPEEPGLGSDVLDVVMPVIAGLDRLADGLLARVAVRQGVEDQQDGLRGGGLGPVDHDPDARIEPEDFQDRSGRGRRGLRGRRDRLVPGPGHHAFVAQEPREIRVGEDFVDRLLPTVDHHPPTDQPDAVAVVDPRGRVSRVEGLDGHSDAPVPAVDGHLPLRVEDPVRDHDVLLVTGDQPAQRLPDSLGADRLVVPEEDRHRRHRRGRRDRRRRQPDRCARVDIIHHLRRRQRAIQQVGDLLGRLGRDRSQEVVVVRADRQVVRGHVVRRLDGAECRLHRDEASEKRRDVPLLHLGQDRVLSLLQRQAGDRPGELHSLRRVRGPRRQVVRPSLKSRRERGQEDDHEKDFLHDEVSPGYHGEPSLTEDFHLAREAAGWETSLRQASSESRA